jgi:hypothetical protein
MMRIKDWLDRPRESARERRKGPRTSGNPREAYSQYTAANRAWLSALRDLAIEMAPHLAAAARLRFSLQLAYLDRRDSRFEYLLRNAPERLRSDGSLSEFVASIDRRWSAEDDVALQRQRPDHEDLCAMIAAVKAKAEEGAEGFSEHLQAVSKTEHCLGLLNVFRQDVERIERELWFM